jgi:hypothetical protein
MNADPIELAKARRAQRLLYLLMAVMIIAPLVLFWVRLR